LLWRRIGRLCAAVCRCHRGLMVSWAFCRLLLFPLPVWRAVYARCRLLSRIAASTHAEIVSCTLVQLLQGVFRLFLNLQDVALQDVGESQCLGYLPKKMRARKGPARGSGGRWPSLGLNVQSK